jgi:hypothetical protein
VLPGVYSLAAVHDSSSFGTGRPVIFTDADPFYVHIYNSQNDGLGTFTQVLTTFGTNNILLGLHSEKLPGANNRGYVFNYRNTDCFKTVATVNEITNAITSAVILPTSCSLGYYPSLVVRNVDNIPLLLYGSNSAGAFIVSKFAVAANAAGGGPYTELDFRSLKGGNSRIGEYNSFVKLPNGGYGIYYFAYNAQGAGSTSHIYSYTSNTAGTTGYVDTTLYSLVNPGVAQRIGVLGIDGAVPGRVFLAVSLQTNQLEIRRGTDALGTSMPVVATITFPAGCTNVGVNTRRTVLLSDNTPAFLATCQNQQIYFVKSTVPSAVGPWITQLVVSGDARFNPIYPTSQTSLHMTEGVNKPHIVYKQFSTNNLIFVQALTTTSF